jgi:hypothetical protein
MTPLIRFFAKSANDEAALLPWIDMGKMRGFDAIGQHPFRRLVGLHLPYDDINIVGHVRDDIKAWLIAHEVDENTYLCECEMIEKGVRRELVPAVIEITDRHPIYGAYDEDADIDPLDVGRMLNILCDFLQRTDLESYRATINLNGITNRRRAKKGKPPQYAWHTVEIKPPSPRGPSRGGTHASPRQHQRRGHWRITRTGKRVWVSDCIVGDPARGTVWKDYKIGD